MIEGHAIITARVALAAQAEKELERLLLKVVPESEYRGLAHAVGGYVRDQYLGLDPDDLDMVVERKGGAEGFTKMLHRMFPQGTSDAHNLGKYPIWHIVFNADVEYKGETYKTKGAELEVAETMREKVKKNQKDRSRDTEFAPLREDIARRDFTVNSLLKDLTTGEFVDLTGVSKQDIKDGVLRADPTVSMARKFAEDPLRLIRLCRFSAKFGWSVPPDVMQAARGNSKRIQIVAPQRIMEELGKAADAGVFHKAIEMMSAIGVLKYVMPEVEAMKGVEQDPRFHAEGDVWQHTMEVLKNAKPDLVSQMAALLHDVGKPGTRSVIDEIVHFYEHEDAGSKMAMDILRRLKFDNKTIEKVGTIVKHHMRPFNLENASDKALRKWVRELGAEMVDAVMELAKADELGSLPGMRTVDAFRERVRNLPGDPPAKTKPVLDGGEIMKALGIKPGPAMRPIVDFLQDLQDEYAVKGEILSKEAAVDAIKKQFQARDNAIANKIAGEDIREMMFWQMGVKMVNASARAAGIWHLPANISEYAKLKTLIQKLKHGAAPENFQEELYHLLGDDSLFDSLDDDRNRREDDEKAHQRFAYYAIIRRIGELAEDDPFSFKNPESHDLLVKLANEFKD